MHSSINKYKGVALSAKQRTGKDTVRNALCKTDSRFYKIGFSDRLKELASEITGLNFFNEEVKLKHRQFLIDFGTHLMREKWDQDFWVKEFIKTIEGNIGIPVLADVRFTNEAETLRKAGFLMVRLVADEKSMKRRGWDSKFDQNPSEAELNSYDKWDIIIDCSDGPDGKHNAFEDAKIIMHMLEKVELVR